MLIQRHTATARVAATATAVVASTVHFTTAVPQARADDPLPPIRAAVEGIRSHSNCTALHYRPDLEGAAQGFARAGQIEGNGYPGAVHGFRDFGDPEDNAIGALLGNMGSAQFEPLNCTYKDFGVGFFRVGERDTVAIALGIPDPPPAPPPPSQTVPPPSPPPPPPPPPPPTNAVRMDLDKQGLSEVVNVTNEANVAGQCTYVASPVNNALLPTISRNSSIDAKGSWQFSVPAPPILTTYHLVLSCHGMFNGKNVEFGHVEQTVSG